MQRKEIVLALLFAALLLLSACSPQQTPTGNAVLDIKKCIDSDSGKNTTVKGTIDASLPDGTEYQDEDRCAFGLLIEHYCQGSLPFSENIRCPKGCENGICKQ
jgi:hypothetical protein